MHCCSLLNNFTFAGHVDCVELLLKHGAKVDGKHIFFASSRGNHALLKQLVTSDSCDGKNQLIYMNWINLFNKVDNCIKL